MTRYKKGTTIHEESWDKFRKTGLKYLKDNIDEINNEVNE